MVWSSNAIMALQLLSKKSGGEASISVTLQSEASLVNYIFFVLLVRDWKSGGPLLPGEV